MSLLFHPRTLNLILKFKKTGDRKLLLEILVLALDNCAFVDFYFLFDVLFSFGIYEDKTMESNKAIEFEKSDKEKELGSAMKLNKTIDLKKPAGPDNAMDSGEVSELEKSLRQNKQKFYKNLLIKLIKKGFSRVNADGLEICHFTERIPKRIAALIKSNRLCAASFLGDMSRDNFLNCIKTAANEGEGSLSSHAVKRHRGSQNKDNGSWPPVSINIKNKGNLDPLNIAKTEVPANTSMLNFVRISQKKLINLEKFAPLPLMDATFVYNINSIVLDTQRKRDDLVCPVPLQFIKHFDQSGPPLYRKRDLLKRAVYSDRPLPYVSYDESSSESVEELENEGERHLSSSELEESTSSGAASENWVEKDSEEEEVVEASRYCKKPVFMYQNVHIETFFLEGAFCNANLQESDDFCEGLSEDFVREMDKFLLGSTASKGEVIAKDISGDMELPFDESILVGRDLKSTSNEQGTLPEAFINRFSLLYNVSRKGVESLSKLLYR